MTQEKLETPVVEEQATKQEETVTAPKADVKADVKAETPAKADAKKAPAEKSAKPAKKVSSKPKTYTFSQAFLAVLGTIPFVVGALCLLYGMTDIDYLGNVFVILKAYTLMIVTFMAGAVWGSLLPSVHTQTANQGKASFLKPVVYLSNVVALTIWGSFLWVLPEYFFAVAVGCFAVILLLDLYLCKQQLIGKVYFFWRLVVTSIVVASLLLVLQLQGLVQVFPI